MNQKSITTPTEVEKYYWEHLSSLDVYNKFHFLTRLYLLTGHPTAKQALDEMYASQLEGRPKHEQWEVLHQCLVNPKQPIDVKRADLLTKYPILREYARYFFIVLFAKKIWDIDLADQLREKIDTSKILTLLPQLMGNREQLLLLSTYALNFIILSTHFLQPSEYKKTISSLYGIWDVAWEEYITHPNGGDSTFDRLVYFVTHLLINDSLFYTRPISEDMKPVHLTRLTKIEHKLSDDISQLSVDCLSELVVAFEMLGKTFVLKNDIYQYLTRHRSANGTYLTEPTDPKKTLAQAEHTNVLFILGYRYL